MVTATIGTGPSPATLSGPVYMGGPYKGGLLSLIAALPAKVGPLDLGTTVLRSAVSLRSTDGGLDVSSDDLPRFVSGIPVDVRSLTVNLNKPGVLLNPTDCSPLAIGGTLTSVLGDIATASAPFQATGCDRLPFAPSISAVAGGKGNTARGKHPMLKATVGQPIEQARIASTTVTLPGTLGASCSAGRSSRRRRPTPAAARHPVRSGPPAPPRRCCRPRSRCPVYLTQGSTLPGVLVQLHGLVNLTLRGHVSVSNGSLVNRFDGIPGRPDLELPARVHWRQERRARHHARHVPRCRAEAQRLLHRPQRRHLLAQRAGAGAAGCRPVITASLRHAKSARPKLLMSFREPAVSTAVKQLTVELPPTLRGVRSRARRGVHVVAGKRRLGRR